jgi:arylformamidase
MKFFDITIPISNDVPIYEGDPKAEVRSFMRLADGAVANVTQLCCGVHTGTHVDAPNHFIEGARRVDDLDLDKLVGLCHVIEIDHTVDGIALEHLRGIAGAERVLFKTRNSEFWNYPEKGFRTDFTYLTPEAARVLAISGVKLVGIDYLSIEEFGSKNFATHKALLQKEVIILEGVDLRQVPPGDYEIICLPLKYLGGEGDGAPARTILTKAEPRQ